MGIAARLDKLVPDLAATLTRFPVPAVLSILLSLYVNFAGPAGSDQFSQVAAGAAAAFLAGGAAHLYAEGRALARAANILLALCAAAAAALVGYWSKLFSTDHMLLFAGLVPLVMIAPFLHANARQGALWLFNMRLWLAALLAAVVALAFAAGLSAIVEAMNLLFDTHLNSRYHEHIWGTAMSLVAPLYGLALTPRVTGEEVDITRQRGSIEERGVSVLVNYVAVPVVLIYAAILHAYAVKILALQSLPRGQVATMVSIFAVGGTAVWLIAWPWRDTGTRLLRWYMKGWFWLLPIPALLIIAAIWRRIADYGVTPDRYGIALIAVWIAALTLYLALRRNRADMRMILGAIGVLCLIGAAGPFGAYGLTATSQVAQFREFLAANGLLANGKATKPRQQLKAGVTIQGYSILSALRDVGGLSRLAPLFDGAADNPFATGATDWSLQDKLAQWVGLQNPLPSEVFVSFTAQKPLAIAPPPGSQLIGPMQLQYVNTADPPPPMSIGVRGADVIIRLQTRTIALPAEKLLRDMQALMVADGSMVPLRLTVAPGVDMLVDTAYGTLSGTPAVSLLRAWFLVTGGV